MAQATSWNLIRRFSGHQKAVTDIEFSPDSRRLLSGSEDTTLLLWDIAGDGAQRVNLTAQQLEVYWETLAAREGRLASAAAGALLASPNETLELFANRLNAGRPLNNEELPKLADDLVSNDPGRHLRAAVRLEEFGAQATATLLAKLSDSSPTAARMRIETVLETIGKYPLSAELLRRRRAIQLLEQIGTPAALSQLTDLAAADPATPASADARAAADRLKRRMRLSGAKVPRDAPTSRLP